MLTENKKLGSCPTCGKAVFKSDYLRTEAMQGDKGTIEHREIYKCLGCKEEMNDDEIIPF